MKQNMIFTMALVFLLGMMAGCGGYSSSKEISDLRDSIAVLKAQLQKLKGAGTRPATSIEGADTHILINRDLARYPVSIRLRTRQKMSGHLP